jgi:hypothetical protein
MVSSNHYISIANLVLLISGIALMAIGFFGVIIDLVHDWRIDEYGSIVAIMIGAVILLSNMLVHTMIPQYQNLRRLEQLRRYYDGQPEGEAKNIRHNIIERTQGIMVRVDLLSDDIRQCVADGMPYDICVKKIKMAKDLLAHIISDSDKLSNYLKQLEDYVEVKKPEP